MSQDQQNVQGSSITDLPANLLQSSPRYRVLSPGEMGLFRRLKRKIGGAIADLFYW